MMQQAIHHHHVGAPKGSGRAQIELTAMERAARMESPPSKFDVALVDVETVVSDAGRQMLHDRAWPAANVDDVVAGPDIEIAVDRSYPGAKEPANGLEALIDLRMLQDVGKCHAPEDSRGICLLVAPPRRTTRSLIGIRNLTVYIGRTKMRRWQRGRSAEPAPSACERPGSTRTARSATECDRRSRVCECPS